MASGISIFERSRQIVLFNNMLEVMVATKEKWASFRFILTAFMKKYY